MRASALMLAIFWLAPAHGAVPGPMLASSFDLRRVSLAGRGIGDDDSRWLLPALPDLGPAPPAPRVRIRGKKIKLRIPLG